MKLSSCNPKTTVYTCLVISNHFVVIKMWFIIVFWNNHTIKWVALWFQVSPNVSNTWMFPKIGEKIPQNHPWINISGLNHDFHHPFWGPRNPQFVGGTSTTLCLQRNKPKIWAWQVPNSSGSPSTTSVEIFLRTRDEDVRDRSKAHTHVTSPEVYLIYIYIYIMVRGITKFCVFLDGFFCNCLFLNNPNNPWDWHSSLHLP